MVEYNKGHIPAKFLNYLLQMKDEEVLVIRSKDNKDIAIQKLAWRA